MCWENDGLAFRLNKPSIIAEKVLKEQLGGMKFSSFIRQVIKTITAPSKPYLVELLRV